MESTASVFGFLSRDKRLHKRLLHATSVEESLQQTIPLALQTYRGEREDAVDVGSTLTSYVFRRVYPTTLKEMEEAVSATLAASEPRISLVSTTCSFSEKDLRLINVRIEYRVGKSPIKKTLNHTIALHP